MQLKLEFQKIASETIQGLSLNKREKPRNYQLGIRCGVCTGSHEASLCKIFQEAKISERWSLARKNKLCFRCLKRNNLQRDCRQEAGCGLAGCKQQHNSLLHVSGSDKGVKNTLDTVSVHHNGSSRKQHMY